MSKRIRKLLALLLAVSLLAGCTAPAVGGSSQSESATGNMQADDTVTETDTVMETDTTTESATETEPESEIVPEPVVTTFTISAVGDCSLGALQTHGYAGSFYQYYDKFGEEYFFQNFKGIFEEDDVTLVNLECVLSDETSRVDKEFSIKGYPEYARILSSASIEACSLGNNHTQDYGKASLTDTKKALEDVGILYAFNDEIAYYTTADGVKVAMLSTSLFSRAKEKYLLNGIEKAKEEGADLIIASCHWGTERVYFPTDYQQEVAHKLIDAGVDLIIGHHPHVLQGIEYYKGKIICYSLGNFCFGANRNPNDKNTLVFQQTFTYVDGILQSEVDARIIPSILSSKNTNNFQPVVAAGEQAAEVLNKMNEYSKPYSKLYFDEDGNLMIGE